MRRIRVLLFALLPLLSACGNDGPTGPTRRVAGVYALAQLNGSTLPTLLFQNPSLRADVLDGSRTLRSNMTYTGYMRILYTPVGGTPQQEFDDESGTFTVAGDTVQFQPINGSPYTATVEDGTLTYSTDRFTATYRKQ